MLCICPTPHLLLLSGILKKPILSKATCGDTKISKNSTCSLDLFDHSFGRDSLAKTATKTNGGCSGSSLDPQLGPVLLFGTGGALVEASWVMCR